MRTYAKWVGLAVLAAVLVGGLLWVSRADYDAVRALRGEPTRGEQAGQAYAQWVSDLHEQDPDLYRRYMAEATRRHQAPVNPDPDQRNREAWAAVTGQKGR